MSGEMKNGLELSRQSWGALRQIEGKSATIGDGLRTASSHFGTIVKYALLSATVGVVVRLIVRLGDKSDSFVVVILSWLVGGAIAAAWSLAVFFAIPVMVFEDLNVRDSLKRSVDIFKETWGEGFTGDVVIGGLSCLVYLAIFLVGGGLVAVGVMNGMSAIVIFGVLVVVLGTTVVNLLYGAVNGIFQTSLYHYALTGDAGPFIDTEMAKAAFKS